MVTEDHQPGRAPGAVLDGGPSPFSPARCLADTFHLMSAKGEDDERDHEWRRCGIRRPAERSEARRAGLLSSTVVALASVAPAYSLAATIGFVVISVGLQAPL